VLELGEQGDEELVARIGTLMSVETGRQIVPLADLAALFSRLREKGLRVGVATMDLEANAQMTLQRFGVRPLVDFVCGCDSGHGNKSGPWMVLAFCASCGLDPRQVVVVGDTPHDMNMARAAGAGMAVAVTSGAAGAGELAPLADHVIDNITALVSILDSQPASSSG
jgi:phosphoglycolate phosphatase